MKQIIKISAVTFGLALLMNCCVYAQDSKKSKEKPRKESNDEYTEQDGDSEEDQHVADEKGSRQRPKYMKPRLGLEGGLNVANYDLNSDFASYDNDPIIGVRIGGLVDLPLSPEFSLQTGIYYALNGTKEYVNSYSFSATRQTIHVHTLEVPFDAVYKFGWPGGGRLTTGAGIFFGYNLGGSISGNSAGYNGKLNIGSENGDDIRAFDFGLGTNVGYELAGGLFFRARFQAGLTNLSPTSAYHTSIHSTSYSLLVGYLFGHNAKHKRVKSKDDEYLNQR